MPGPVTSDPSPTAPRAASDVQGLVESLKKPSDRDVVIQPHPDDACFSLGAFLGRRGRGTLLTLFPISGHVGSDSDLERSLKQQDRARRTRSITRIRAAEDEAFARACGLQARHLDCADAVVRGEPSFSPANDALRTAAETVRAQLVPALMAPWLGREPARRPWLFCPCGIGAHVDHLAALLAVASVTDLLASRYQLAFYEDLPYASAPVAREAGLQNLRHALGPNRLRRVVLAMDEQAFTAKHALASRYASQHVPGAADRRSWTPASSGGQPEPHEALWLLERPAAA